MRAERLTLDSDGNLEVDVASLPTPEANELLLATQACAICATDLHIYEGRQPMGAPIVPGHEFVGTVDKRGDSTQTDITGKPIRKGDDVVIVPTVTCGECYGCKHTPDRPASCEQAWAHGFRHADESPYFHGGLSEYLLAEENTQVIKLSPSVAPEQGVLTEPLAVASLAVDRGINTSRGCQPDKESASIVVQGVGTIGLLTILTASYRGFDHIIAVDVRSDRLSKAADFGATHTIALEGSDPAELLQSEIGDAIPVDRKADVVIEATGHPDAIKQASMLPRHAGSVITLGNVVDAGTTDINPAKIVQNELTIEGVYGAPPSAFETAMSILTESAEEKKLRGIIEDRNNLEDATELFEQQATGTIYRGLISPN